MTNANFVTIPRVVHATTPFWAGKGYIQGLDCVLLHIGQIIDYTDEKMYHLDPITTNRNLANEDRKWIYIRLSYYPSPGSALDKSTANDGEGKSDGKLHKYYALGHLVGCNADLVADDLVNYDTIEWGYVVLNF